MSDRAQSTLLRNILVWTTALTVPAAIGCWFLLDLATALGVVAGSALGAMNFVLLTRSLQKMFANPEEARASHTKWTVPLAMLLKWPLILGGLALIMFFLPVSPQGVAIGAILSLAAGATAALREHQAQV